MRCLVIFAAGFLMARAMDAVTHHGNLKAGLSLFAVAVLLLFLVWTEKPAAR